MELVKYVIIGTGFAGASTAYHLALQGAKGVVVLEKEPYPGVHASGRNAAMIRQVVPNPVVAEVARKSTLKLADPDRDLQPYILYRKIGSLLLGRGNGWGKLLADAADAQQGNLGAECWSPTKAVDRVPVLEGARFRGAVWNPEDGVIELAPLLQGFLSGARDRGVDIHFQAEVKDLRPDGERIRVETNKGEFDAECVVNAAGAWSPGLGVQAGSSSLSIQPHRRHLFHTSPLDIVDENWPFVWDVSSDWYFRPETGGLLMSPCDQTKHDAGEPVVDPEVEDMLAQKVADHLPGMPDLPIQKRWACLRTFTPDGKFVIGWDPVVPKLFWVSGLGGHGVTCAYGIGEIAARGILGEDDGRSGPFAPTRLAK